MSEPDDRGDERVPPVFARQLRHFDNMLADLRQLYESLSPSERVQLRAWLERVDALAVEGHGWGAVLRVHVENDECDEDGNVVRWADADFSSATMLAAVRGRGRQGRTSRRPPCCPEWCPERRWPLTLPAAVSATPY